MAVGKWAYLQDQLEKWEPPKEQQAWFKKVMRRKEELKQEGVTHVEAGRRRFTLRHQKAELEEKVKELNLELEAVNQFLIEYFDTSETDSFKVDGNSLSHGIDVYSSIEDPDELNKWLEEEGLDSLKTLHHKTLEGIVRERLEHGLPEPRGVKIFFKDKINIRESK